MGHRFNACIIENGHCDLRYRKMNADNGQIGAALLHGAANARRFVEDWMTAERWNGDTEGGYVLDFDRRVLVYSVGLPPPRNGGWLEEPMSIEALRARIQERWPNWLTLEVEDMEDLQAYAVMHGGWRTPDAPQV